MEQELSCPADTQPALLDQPKSQLPKKVRFKLPQSVDIRIISANGFQLNTCQPRVEIFSITLDRLDRMIEDRVQELDLQTPVDLSIESLKQKVPTFLHEYLDIFSKE